jgi:hypothetical protein
MTYKTKRIQYKITDRYTEWRYVDGYAIDSGLPVRVCVHRAPNNLWACDHYDSGLWFGAYHKTMRDAIEYAVPRMKIAIESGELARAIKECGL